MTMLVDIVSCARCGQDHEELLFKTFEHPVVVVEEDAQSMVEITHWCMCPVKDEPILMRIIDAQMS